MPEDRLPEVQSGLADLPVHFHGVKATGQVIGVSQVGLEVPLAVAVADEDPRVVQRRHRGDRVAAQEGWQGHVRVEQIAVLVGAI